jgi:hypothetical protein
MWAWVELSEVKTNKRKIHFWIHRCWGQCVRNSYWMLSYLQHQKNQFKILKKHTIYCTNKQIHFDLKQITKIQDNAEYFWLNVFWLNVLASENDLNRNLKQLLFPKHIKTQNNKEVGIQMKQRDNWEKDLILK